MGERKVLNKYYPPDFDPSLVPRKPKGAKQQVVKVRMMLAMSVRCNTCGEFTYKGTKFNARIEDAVGEEYLGMIVKRLYIKCKKCSAEIVIKTDPKNADYVVEAGATRNYEPWRDADAAKDEANTKRAVEEDGNAMKALENRTKDSKREIDILNALDEVRALKREQNKLTSEQVLSAIWQKSEEDKATFGEAEADFAAASRDAFERQTAQLLGFVRRIDDDEDDEEGGGEGAAGEGAAGRGGAKRQRTADPVAAVAQRAPEKAAAKPAAFAWGAPQQRARPQVVITRKGAPAPGAGAAAPAHASASAAAAAAAAAAGGAEAAAVAGGVSQGGGAGAGAGAGMATGAAGSLSGLLGSYSSSEESG